MTASEERFPRELSPLERDLLLWVLPKGKPGYSEARSFVEEDAVIGGGRRGEGNYILGRIGHLIDVESPLPPVLAHGVVESEEGLFTISVREPQGDQLEFEISHPTNRLMLSALREKRRWTYSYWLPSNPCPACGSRLREVVNSAVPERKLVLAVCVRDQRIWFYDSLSGISHPIPVTSMYNELMLEKKIHDPAIALNSKRLFSDLDSFSDRELMEAFSNYNRLRNRVPFHEPLIVASEEVPGLFRRMVNRFLMRRA